MHSLDSLTVFQIYYAYQFSALVSFLLTLSNPVMWNGFTSKCLGPYWSNPPLLIFWHLGTLALSPVPQSAKCQKLKIVGYISMTLNALAYSFLPQSEKCGKERLNLDTDLLAYKQEHCIVNNETDVFFEKYSESTLTAYVSTNYHIIRIWLANVYTSIFNHGQNQQNAKRNRHRNNIQTKRKRRPNCDLSECLPSVILLPGQEVFNTEVILDLQFAWIPINHQL